MLVIWKFLNVLLGSRPPAKVFLVLLKEKSKALLSRGTNVQFLLWEQSPLWDPYELVSFSLRRVKAHFPSFPCSGMRIPNFSRHERGLYTHWTSLEWHGIFLPSHSASIVWSDVCFYCSASVVPLCVHPLTLPFPLCPPLGFWRDSLVKFL